MKLEEFFAMVNAIKYKPGWNLTAVTMLDHGGDLVRVSLSARVLDARLSNQTITVFLHDVFTRDSIELSTPLDMLYRIRHFIEGMETHETREWFTYNGTRPFDPHAGGYPDDVVKAALAGETYGR